jgi:hypothetical protein
MFRKFNEAGNDTAKSTLHSYSNEEQFNPLKTKRICFI